MIIHMHRKRVLIILWTVLVILIGICVYFYFSTGYAFYVKNVKPLDLYSDAGEVREEYNHEFYKELAQSDYVYFIGDSITCGSRNGEHSWYEPISNAMDFKCKQIAVGGLTSWDMVQIIQELTLSGDGENPLFVINLGVNDVLRNEPETCASNSEEYSDNMKSIVSTIMETYPKARFAFIAPWRVYFNTLNFSVPLDKQEKILSEFDEALQKYCQEEGYTFVNPNPYIRQGIDSKPKWYYLLDGLHPNSRYGTTLYSEAVMRYDNEQYVGCNNSN